MKTRAGSVMGAEIRYPRAVMIQRLGLGIAWDLGVGHVGRSGPEWTVRNSTMMHDM